MSPIISLAHSLLFKIGWFDTCANSYGRFKTPVLNDFLISCNFAPFYPIEMGFSPEIIIFYTEE